MFAYFGTNYPWNVGVALALDMGGEMAEIEDACRPLLALPSDSTTQERVDAWFSRWSALAQRLERLSDEASAKGWRLSAGQYLARASCYHLLAERMLGWTDPRRLPTYKRILELFARMTSLSGHRTERVEVRNDRGQALSGYLRAPAGDGPFPAVVFFNGFDTIKEMHYLMYSHLAVERGLAVLFVDQEGTGEAMRLHDVKKRLDSEKSAAPFVDDLQRRSFIDAERIGVAGISNGGYDAPRAAVFEKRLKCAACLGAFFNGDDYKSRVEGKDEDDVTHGLSDLDEHMMKVMGANTPREAYTLFAQRDLSGVIEQLEAPLLIVHGENDKQVPLWHVERTIDGAKRSRRVELKLFTADDGCADHCGGDNSNMHGRYIFDWCSDMLHSER